MYLVSFLGVRVVLNRERREVSLHHLVRTSLGLLWSLYLPLELGTGWLLLGVLSVFDLARVLSTKAETGFLGSPGWLTGASARCLHDPLHWDTTALPGD